MTLPVNIEKQIIELCGRYNLEVETTLNYINSLIGNIEGYLIKDSGQGFLIYIHSRSLLYLITITQYYLDCKIFPLKNIIGIGTLIENNLIKIGINFSPDILLEIDLDPDEFHKWTSILKSIKKYID
jgi:hypothetical protein